jgi:hypothetical protein
VSVRKRAGRICSVQEDSGGEEAEGEDGCRRLWAGDALKRREDRERLDWTGLGEFGYGCLSRGIFGKEKRGAGGLRWRRRSFFPCWFVLSSGRVNGEGSTVRLNCINAQSGNGYNGQWVQWVQWVQWAQWAQWVPGRQVPRRHMFSQRPLPLSAAAPGARRSSTLSTPCSGTPCVGSVDMRRCGDAANTSARVGSAEYEAGRANDITPGKQRPILSHAQSTLSLVSNPIRATPHRFSHQRMFRCGRLLCFLPCRSCAQAARPWPCVVRWHNTREMLLLGLLPRRRALRL